MNLFKFDKDVVSKNVCISINKTGVKFIKKISGKGEKFLEGEFVNDIEFFIDDEKMGVIFEVCFEEKITIVIKDEKKEVLKKSYFILTMKINL